MATSPEFAQEFTGMCARALLYVACGFLMVSAAAGAQEKPISMANKDFEAFRKCAEASGQAQIDSCNSYLEAYPKSTGVEPALEVLLTAYDSANDSARLLATADRLLVLDPANLRALAFESTLHLQAAEKLTDQDAKRAEFDRAAKFAHTGLEAEKPATVSASEWDALRDATRPVFEAVITRVRLWGTMLPA